MVSVSAGGPAGSIIPYYTIHYTLLYYIILHYITLYIQHHTTLPTLDSSVCCSTLLSSIILYYVMLYYTIQYCTILQYTTLYYTALYHNTSSFFVLYCRILDHTILCCMVRYYGSQYISRQKLSCTVLYFTIPFSILVNYVIRFRSGLYHTTPYHILLYCTTNTMLHYAVLTILC